jgi:hypothetical protein
MLDKRKLKIKIKKKNCIVIATTSCLVLVLKQGMFNIRRGTALPDLFKGEIAPLHPQFTPMDAYFRK